MAATREYFEDNTLNVQNGDTTDKVLIPTHLAEYGSTTGQIATKFKLDIVLPHHAGFLGGIRVSGSSNLAYHNTHNKNIDGTTNSKGDNTSNPNRLSKLRIYKDGTEYALFNDGGVNTKPLQTEFRAQQGVLDNNIAAYAWAEYGIRFYSLWKSSKFANSTTREVYLSGTLNNIDPIAIYDAMFKGETTAEESSLILMNELEQNDEIILTLKHGNEEGYMEESTEFYCGPSITGNMLIPYYGNGDNPAEEPEGEAKLLFMFTADASRLNDETVVGTSEKPTDIIAYVTDAMNLSFNTADKNNLAPAGWYDFGYKTAMQQTKMYKIDNNGQIIKYVATRPPIVILERPTLTPVINPNNTISIRVSVADLNVSKVVNGLRFYKDNNTTQAEYIMAFVTPYTLQPTTSGTTVNTGQLITVTIDPTWTHFALSLADYSGVSTPATMLIKNPDSGVIDPK